jgi:hypothetical protein
MVNKLRFETVSRIIKYVHFLPNSFSASDVSRRMPFEERLLPNILRVNIIFLSNKGFFTQEIVGNKIVFTKTKNFKKLYECLDYLNELEILI